MPAGSTIAGSDRVIPIGAQSKEVRGATAGRKLDRGQHGGPDPVPLGRRPTRRRPGRTRPPRRRRGWRCGPPAPRRRPRRARSPPGRAGPAESAARSSSTTASVAASRCQTTRGSAAPPRALIARARSRWVTETSPAATRRRSAASATGSDGRAVARLGAELDDRPAVDRGRVGGDHVEPVHGQARGDRAEQPAPVGRGHRDPVAVQVHGGQVAVEQLRVGRRAGRAARRCPARCAPGGPARRSAGPSSPTRRPGRWRASRPGPARAAGRGWRCRRPPRRPWRWSPGRSGRGGWPRRAAAGAAGPASRRWRRRPAAGRSGWRSRPAIGAPTMLWSPGRPLPTSCRKAPISSRSGRSTSRVYAVASYAACTRCRSRVKRCTGWCCGQAAHPGPLRQPGVDQAVPVAGLPGGQQARRRSRAA